MTDEERTTVLREFYQARMVPLGEEFRRKGQAFFPLRPDASAASYYRVRSDETNYISSCDVSDMAASLAVLWADDAQLLALIPSLLELMSALAQSATEVAEVPAFVYAMF